MYIFVFLISYGLAMQKMINLTLAIDVVFILAAFIILYFDKSNSANQLSKNLKSFFLGRKDKTINIKSALLFIDIVLCSAFLIVLHYIWGTSDFNFAVLSLMTIVLISAVAFFPLLFLKSIVLAKRVCNRSLTSTH
jgi:hypothetical protein